MINRLLPGVLLLTLLPACVVSRLRTSGQSGLETSVSTYSVAWPWLDSDRALRGAELGSCLDSQTLKLATMTDSANVSTNLNPLIEAFGRGFGTAIRSAVVPSP